MTTVIAEVLFGALVVAVFVLLVVISVTFDDVIGDGSKRSKRTEPPSQSIRKPEKPLTPELVDADL